MTHGAVLRRAVRAPGAIHCALSIQPPAPDGKTARAPFLLVKRCAS
jgi:hypothetical protein